MLQPSEERTSWTERRKFEKRIMGGDGLSTEEQARLIADADAGERAMAVLEALEETLRERWRISIVDFTTDDDEGQVRLELIQDGEPKDSIGE